MIRLINIGLKKQETVFHMFLHSSSLIDNTTGLNNEANARENICKRIAAVISHLKEHANIDFCTLSQARAKLIKLGENV